MASLPDPGLDRVIVVNSLVVEEPHTGADRQECLADRSLYQDHNGTTVMCCHCRRTRRVGRLISWDWVPGYVADPPEPVSHDICPVCLSVFYPVDGEG
jgi:hypothetical protein